MQLPWQCAYARSQGRTTYHIIIQPIMSIFFCIELSLASYMIALLTCCSIQALHCWSCRDSRDPGQVKKRRPEIGKNNRQKKKKKKNPSKKGRLSRVPTLCWLAGVLLFIPYLYKQGNAADFGIRAPGHWRGAWPEKDGLDLGGWQ